MVVLGPVVKALFRTLFDPGHDADSIRYDAGTLEIWCTRKRDRSLNIWNNNNGQGGSRG